MNKAAETYGKVAAWKGTPADKLKLPSTFLHEDRWRDWLPPDGASYLEAVKLAQSQQRDRPRLTEQRWAESYEEARERYGDEAPVSVDVEFRDMNGGSEYAPAGL